jgi:predicted nucleic acid-binding protein
MPTCLLDTNIAIDVIKRQPPEVLGRLNPDATRMAMSVVTLAERLHIAAHARSEALTLLTNNVAEFQRVPALQIENWL